MGRIFHMYQSSNRLNGNALLKLFILLIQGNLITFFLLLIVMRYLFPWIQFFPLIDNASLLSLDQTDSAAVSC